MIWCSLVTTRVESSILLLLIATCIDYRALHLFWNELLNVISLRQLTLSYDDCGRVEGQNGQRLLLRILFVLYKERRTEGSDRPVEWSLSKRHESNGDEI